ncbi:MAG: hypothetical protein HZB45_28260 [Mycolicibacterium rufum]|nr:hypothetical protein [Mycolicibacterium rufum]
MTGTVSVVARGVLFVSSYAPLLILFAVLKSFGPGWPSRVCVIVGLGSVALLIVGWMVTQRKLSFNYLEFQGARSRDADVMAYVVSYVVPFAAATNADDPATRWALALFAALIAVLYIRAAVFCVHPLLLLAGIHVYEATHDGVPTIVLTRQRHLRQQCRLQVVRIAPNVYAEVHR